MTHSPLFAILLWIFLLPTLWVVGSYASVRYSEENPQLRGIGIFSLGLGVYGYFLVLLASIGYLRVHGLYAFILFSLLLGRGQIKSCFSWLQNLFASVRTATSWFQKFCLITLALSLLLTALLCFLPEVANDSLGIHLQLAKTFVKNNSIEPAYFELTSYRPLFMTMLYTTGIFFQNIAVAKLFHWLYGVTLILALYFKMMEFTENKTTPLFLTLMLWLTPTIMNQVTATYLDAGVTLCIFLGYCSVTKHLKDLKPSGFFYGGLFIGMAVAMRSLALSSFLILSAMLFLKALRTRTLTPAFKAFLFFSVGVFITSGFWFIRDWIYTGNPVYPYLGGLFGDQDLAYVDAHYFKMMGIPKSISSFLMVPWNLTFKPQYFDYHHWAGPFYLCALPIAIYAFFTNHQARIHLLFVFGSTIVWYFTGQNVRYLLPTFPIYLLAVAIGCESFLTQPGKNLGGFRLLLMLAAAGLTIALSALTIYHYRYQFKVLSGAWTQHEYLQKMERTIPIAHWTSQNLPSHARILSLTEPRSYYFDHELIQDFEFNMRKRYKTQTTSDSMRSILMDNGITHIMDAQMIGEGDHPTETTGKENRPIDMLIQNTRMSRPLIHLASNNILGARYNYQIYEILSPSDPPELNGKLSS